MLSDAETVEIADKFSDTSDALSLLELLSQENEDTVLIVEDMKVFNGNEEIIVKTVGENYGGNLSLFYKVCKDRTRFEKRKSPVYLNLEETNERQEAKRKNLLEVVAKLLNEKANLGVNFFNEVLNSLNLVKLCKEFEEQKTKIFVEFEIMFEVLKAIGDVIVNSEVSNEECFLYDSKNPLMRDIYNEIKTLWIYEQSYVLKLLEDEIDNPKKLKHLSEIYKANYPLMEQYRQAMHHHLTELSKVASNAGGYCYQHENGQSSNICENVSDLIYLWDKHRRDKIYLIELLELANKTLDSNTDSKTDIEDDEVNYLKTNIYLLQEELNLLHIKMAEHDFNLRMQEQQHKENIKFKHEIIEQIHIAKKKELGLKVKLERAKTNWAKNEEEDKQKSEELEQFITENVANIEFSIIEKFQMSEQMSKIEFQQALEDITESYEESMDDPLIEIVDKHFLQMGQACMYLDERMEGLQNKLKDCDDRLSKYIINNLMELNVRKVTVANLMQKIESVQYPKKLEDKPTSVEKLKKHISELANWNFGLETKLLLHKKRSNEMTAKLTKIKNLYQHLIENSNTISETKELCDNNSTKLKNDEITVKKQDNNKISELLKNNGPEIDKKEKEIGKLKMQTQNYEELISVNYELEKTVSEQKKVMGPFKKLLKKYKKERDDLRAQKEDVEKELEDQGIICSELMGHQNKNQKIKHVQQLQLRQTELTKLNEELTIKDKEQLTLIENLKKELQTAYAIQGIPENIAKDTYESLTPPIKSPLSAISKRTPTFKLTYPKSPLEKYELQSNIKVISPQVLEANTPPTSRLGMKSNTVEKMRLFSGPSQSSNDETITSPSVLADEKHEISDRHPIMTYTLRL